jgi:hypothetical protein
MYSSTVLNRDGEICNWIIKLCEGVALNFLTLSIIEVLNAWSLVATSSPHPSDMVLRHGC